MTGRIRQFLPMLVGVFLLWAGAAPSWALQPDELLLITNSNMPEGRALAELYEQKRGIPEGRILELPLAEGETMSAEQYEQRVVPAVRAFLTEQQLEQQVRCLVTFYGVPLRIAARRLVGDDQGEMAALTEQQKRISGQIQQIVAELEQRASQLDPTFKPPARQQVDLPALARRADAAIRRIESAGADQPPEARQQALAQTMRAIELLSGPAGIVQRVQINRDADPDSPQAEQLAAVRQAVADARERVQQLQSEPNDPAARAEMRELVARHFGLFATAQVIGAHIARFDMDQTSAAVDNELALLWWDKYPRSRWILNPMHHEIDPVKAAGAPRTLMVSRIDAPTPEIARQIILDTLQAEAEGLSGNFAIDIGGSLTLGSKGQRRDEYTVWDDHLRSLAGLVKDHTDFELIMDQAAGVFTPGTVRGCALYCGWYSLRNYVPAFEFSRGAVAYHIASFELRAMRDPEEKGWVANLLRNGVVATIGPVEEPFLQAFPKPDEFFGLLMTGRLTLAEIYWKTAPMASWKMVLIGDPLYRPFASNPALPANALPEPLQAASNNK